MTKKKTSRKKHQEASAFADTSEEELNDTTCQVKCPHVSRAVNFGRIKKGLKNMVNLNICMGCLEKSKDGDVVDEDNQDVEVWMCLQCGYRGCGRLSPNQHAIQHNKTLHSDCHSIVLSILTNILWCYDCDREVQLSTTNLKQCVDFITKFKSNKENNFANKDVKKESIVQPERGDSPTVEKPLDIKQVLPVDKPGNLLKSSKKGTILANHAQVKGLKNLGNTCFFNAVMQNLSLTTLLGQELNNSSNSEYLWEVPHLIVNQEDVIEDETKKLKVSLQNQFVLVQALSQFLREMSTSSSNKVVNPSSLFTEIAKKSPQFRHFQQQDSHELLRHLLDGVRQEEVKRQKRGILKTFKLENKSPESVNEETKKLVKAYGCYASHTLVEKIFGGLLISTVLCEECKMSSQVFEPFMDLSLPVFEEKATRNQKVEKDSDENVTNGFVLTKESKGPTKPSKHQEKKMKQQAKRDRKKGRDLKHDKLTIADLNKDETNSSLYENTKPEDEKVNNEDLTAEDPTANDMSEMAPTANEMSEMAPTANDMSETVSTANNMSETEQTVNNMSETTPTANDMSETMIDGYQKSFNEVRNTSEDNNNELQDESVQSLHDAPYQIDQLENHDGKNLSEDKFPENELVHQSIEASKTPHLATDTATKDNTLHTTQDITEKIDHDSQDAMKDPDHDQQDILDSTDHNSEDTVENLNHDTQDTMENLDHDIQDSTEDLDHDTQSPMKNTDHNSEDTVENLDTRDTTENPDHDIQAITEGPNHDTGDIFNTQDSTALEDRLQALCSQITDMRIRRDSDRQENLLVSSRNSSDGETPRLNTSHESLADDTNDDRIRDNWSRSVSEEHTKEWIMRSLTTLKQRCHASPLEVSIISCLSHFTKSELLTGNNKFRCENCTSVRRKRMNSKTEVAYTNASKQLLIFSPPAILTLHLKRFQQVGFTLKKVNRFVEFPLVLDLAPYCSSASLILPHMAAVKDEVLYSLYGIVEHSGRLNNGHYTAFVKASHMTANHSFMNQWPLGQCDLEQLLQKFSKIKSPAEDGASGSTDEEDRRWFYVSDCHSKEVKEADVLRCQAYILFYQRIK